MMEDLKQAATIALQGIDTVLGVIAKLPIPGSKRNALAVTLLRASIDHARALVLLISIHPHEFGASAVALHRIQIDTMLRGAFFAKNATDEEVEYFIEHDDMPSRPDSKGKPKRLNPKDLAPLVGEVLAVGDNKKLISMVENTWNVLCSMVHGGMTMVVTYNNAEIGFHLEPQELVEIVGNTLGLTQLAMVGVSAVSTADKQQLSDIFQEPHKAQKAFHEFLVARFPKPETKTPPP
jgi:hypothetical protein